MSARLLLHEMVKIEKLLPGWSVLHTGGGVFIALKDCRITWKGKECVAGISVDGDIAAAYRVGDTWLDAAKIKKKVGCFEEEVQEVVFVASDGERRLYPGADLLSFGDLIEIEKAMDILGGVDFGGVALDILCPTCRVRGVKVFVAEGYLAEWNGNVYLCCSAEGKSTPLFDSAVKMDAPGHCARCGNRRAVGDFILIQERKKKQAV
ncbi:hypothetical protein V3F56_06295 [Moorellaceae bacterium AZ2]